MPRTIPYAVPMFAFLVLAGCSETPLDPGDGSGFRDSSSADAWDGEGGPADRGQAPDSSQPPDAGDPPDSGESTDTAHESDGPVDAGQAADASGPEIEDGGETADVPTVEDTGRPEDSGAPFDGGLPGNHSRLVEHTFPASVPAGRYFDVTVTMQNTGDTSWTPGAEYRLGAVDNNDPFNADARVDLTPGAHVEPGAIHVFTIPFVAPGIPGVHRTDWRMLEELVEWFGETAVADVDVQAHGCMNPTPPPIDLFKVVIHNDQGYKKVLDSTALVYGREYCTEIGFTDGRSRCPSRPEGHPQVEACNEFLVGRAKDTGRIGPTWTYNGLPCLESSDDGRCVNHYDNQFLVFVFGPGTARACPEQGVCGELVIP